MATATYVGGPADPIWIQPNETPNRLSTLSDICFSLWKLFVCFLMYYSLMQKKQDLVSSTTSYRFQLSSVSVLLLWRFLDKRHRVRRVCGWTNGRAAMAFGQCVTRPTLAAKITPFPLLLERMGISHTQTHSHARTTAAAHEAKR